MAINTALLVAAPMLQDYFVDKLTGQPLSSGIVKAYKDNSRTSFKNWYYQTGTPGNYTYTQLPNPMTLTSVGTIADVNGVDTIPFFYPYSESDNVTPEPYYFVVEDSNQNTQFVRENFPFIPSNPSSLQTPTLRNYIINNRFWRNIGSLDAKQVTQQVIAPSQHDGFSYPDLQYIKNTTGATETITFNKFALGSTSLIGDITPEYYINHSCTGSQVGETQKVYQFPISLHVKTLENVQASFTIQAQNISGDNSLEIFIYQFLGTGVTSPTPLLIDTISLTNAWQKYTVSFTFQSAQGASLGTGGDDAYYLQIGMPLSTTFQTNFTLPSIYLSTTSSIPTNNFDTYDQIDSVITTPRTGDFRTSLNSFSPFGWVAANDGVISNSGSITPPTGVPTARANIDTWRLFDLLWTNTNVAVAPIYDSTGASSSKGASSILDWSANKQIQLTLALGRSLLGLPPIVSVTYDRATTPSWGSVAGVFSVSSGTTSLFYVGAPVFLTGTMPASGNFTANTIYYAIPAIDGSSTTQFQLATTYANAIAGTAIAAGGASDNGSNLVINFTLGGAFGESRHIQLLREIGAHTHTISAFAQAGASNVRVADAFTDNSNTITQTSSSTGNSDPFNIVQPSSYYNVFIKL